MASITPTSNPELYVDGGKAKTASASLDGDFNFFLKMLTTQLQNQDPTEPMDVSQMTQQIAQYSGVEQQIRTNQNLEKMLSQSKQSQLSTAVSYIGKEIETDGNVGTLAYAQSGDKVYGQAVFSYMLPSAAGSAQITILDQKGKAVFQGQGTLKEGRNVVVWDGVNSFNGEKMAGGSYTIRVTAKNAAGSDMAVDARAVGLVDTVETDADGNIVLNVGDVRVKYSDILAVREPTPFYIPADTPEDTTADSGSDSADDSGTDPA